MSVWTHRAVRWEWTRWKIKLLFRYSFIKVHWALCCCTWKLIRGRVKGLERFLVAVQPQPSQDTVECCLSIMMCTRERAAFEIRLVTVPHAILECIKMQSRSLACRFVRAQIAYIVECVCDTFTRFSSSLLFLAFYFSAKLQIESRLPYRHSSIATHQKTTLTSGKKKAILKGWQCDASARSSISAALGSECKSARST